MDLVQILKTRYTAKAYDPARSIPADTVERLLASLRFSPSSVNAQPWHFIVADDEAGKARVAKAASGPYAYNAAKIVNASHVVILCARTTLPPAHLDAVLEQEQADGRYADNAAKEAGGKLRTGYVGQHEQAGDVLEWNVKQVYIALGFLLLSAGELGVDATPMEGFDVGACDVEFDLAAQGLTPALIVSLGYHSGQDFNARLPKSRLPQEKLFSRA